MTRRSSKIGSILSYPSTGPLLGLFIVYLLFALAGPATFFSTNTVEAIIRQTVTVGITALGMTVVIVGGGIDLSVGSIVALVTVCIAYLIQLWNNPMLAVLGGIAVGVLCGLINGFLITRLQVVPFIVTLGSLLVFRGIAKGWSGEQKVDAPLSWINELLAVLTPQNAWQLLPMGAWILLILALFLFALLRYTRLGLHITAVGSNEQTAILCGLPASRTKTTMYVISGLFAGIAGVMQFSRLTVGDPTVAVGLELDAIAAVVIGGGSLRGGEGSVWGTIYGALIMTVIRSGCAQIGLASWAQEIVAGTIIVGAVALDQLRHLARRQGR